MSYTPHVWQDGEIITAQKINALEDAVGDALTNDDAIDIETIEDICDQ